ncbi:anaerobic ribonucleoside-triphosphate reductase activating protein [Blautia wexlerae]|jgi:anaerobic ribonucleoside-triphosphate reductase activating protein|uniref:Anaerobic ribonucleoside-triphosphate reductase-activating protein n=1 Tax=Blautia wexlerae TaxID=418240 RepID=A0A6L8T1H5_9FIRM|nr:anaerobic ribonucleoside-triphosphate reductase activating protein [Blautia wexlerae]MZL32261.1 anaerobic ribonucleoside-triphosphate reductase activating protein [Blautia wexlerae]MZT14229.1 anaerobic ribonucleoside-triphosphate reductase activating protein [Blautia wexlerae]MZT32299.1 anaerobic ribonucleoside-triphosphate reductase activating protein [Blautia wexlerae]MZT40137.1 anaerobic ribonucleoside-triphosphate reductase activating protein [Blautia wexlerae]MZT45743.1 anaerobic ribon
MNYHDIKHDDMNNGPGLRVTLFVSGCDHYCNGCQNPETWDTKSGIPFDDTAIEEIFEQLNNDYISGITFSGGDPLNANNRVEVCSLIHQIRLKYGKSKSIWIYTGYTWEEIVNTLTPVLLGVDVLIDGMFDKDLADVNYHWAGSTNQRVIDVQRSLEEKKVILYKDNIGND